MSPGPCPGWDWSCQAPHAAPATQPGQQEPHKAPHVCNPARALGLLAPGAEAGHGQVAHELAGEDALRLPHGSTPVGQVATQDQGKSKSFSSLKLDMEA